MNDERFDRLLEEMRAEGASPEQIKEAQERVRQQLAAAQSPACEELHDELPDYVDGRLPEARRLLIHDHVSRCVECRHTLAEIKGRRRLIAFPGAQRRRRQRVTRWAIAAGVVLAVLYVGGSSLDTALAPAGPRATIESIDGRVVRLSGESGGTLGDGEVIRTTAGSRAILRLDDGSQVELNERTELSVHGAWSGNTIRLERGDIMVEAAQQGAGRLRVVTRDSIASVKGTVFAVSSATTGSLVSVVEGSVEVSQPGFEELLGAGQQAATTAALTGIGMAEAISWSNGAETYFALLAELARIEERVVGGAGLRTQSPLLASMPSNTIGYFAIPNLDEAVGEVLSLLDRQSISNNLIATFMESVEGREMRDMLYGLQSVTPLLGDEIVFVITGATFDDNMAPAMLAQVPAGREDQLAQALADLSAEHTHGLAYRIGDGVLLVTDTPADLALVGVQLGGGAGSPFAAQIEERYDRGVGWLAALDVRSLGREIDDEGGIDVSRALGVRNMSYLFVEQRSDALGDDTQATLAFDGARSGIASWIGQPGPIGSAEYVSSDAIAVSSGSTRDPREAFDQLMELAGPSSEIVQEIREMELETGISIGDDIASSLGSEFVIAIEQLTVPTPSWIAVLEVINAGALDAAVRRMADSVNDELAADGVDERLIVTRENVNGRDWTSISASVDDFALHWTHDRGYMIVSIDRAAVLQAIAVRDSGTSLVRSSQFQREFPRDGGLHNSGFFWLNTAGVADQLAQLTSDGAAAALAITREPVLVVITGEEDAVRWSSRTRFTALLLDIMLAQPLGEAAR